MNSNSNVMQRANQRRTLCVWMIRTAHWVMPMIMLMSFSLSAFALTAEEQEAQRYTGDDMHGLRYITPTGSVSAPLHGKSSKRPENSPSRA